LEVSAVTKDGRIARTAAAVRGGHTGPSVKDIVDCVKAGAITEREAIDALERDFAAKEEYRQRRELPIGLMAEDAIFTENCPLVELTAREAENIMLRVVNSLPGRQAQCVELYYFDGYTQDEVAERLDIPQQNVSLHLARARRALALALVGVCVFSASNALDFRIDLFQLLMTAPIREHKAASFPMFPFEIWQHWGIGGEWSGNGVYATRYVNRLGEYLADCFEVPPVVWPYFVKRR